MKSNAGALTLAFVAAMSEEVAAPERFGCKKASLEPQDSVLPTGQYLVVNADLALLFSIL